MSYRLVSSNQNSRVLILSQRNIKDHVIYCCSYELEDIICNLDLVHLFAPTKSYDLAQQFYTQIKRIARSSQFADFIKPDPNPSFLTQEYELFFAVFTSPWEFLTINSIKNWRKKCKKAICYLHEIWVKDIPGWKSLLELLRDFDHIFIGHYHGTQEISEITQRPCTYLPPGVDTLSFSPFPLRPDRSIDVCYIGRRSSVTHKALLEMAEQKQIFYYYDTAKNFHVLDWKEHRSLLANLLKRSRYSIVNASKFNQLKQTNGQLEFGYRFFEGAAAGTVMIGSPPATAAFDKHFGWSDAVIRIPPDAPNIRDTITALDAQPERLSRISRNNVVNSLLQHDWVYRWREVLETVNLKPTPKMLERESYLKSLAEALAVPPHLSQV